MILIILIKLKLYGSLQFIGMNELIKFPNYFMQSINMPQLETKCTI